MTDRIYYNDSYLTTFTAKAAGEHSSRLRVYLDHTAFYPTSGGQQHDLGEIAGVAVTDVIEDEHGIAHLMAEPLELKGELQGRIDWRRRFDHMQQHTGQHLLSAVLAELHQAETISFHMGAQASTIDLAVNSLTDSQLVAAETRANEVIAENREVTVSFEDSGSAAGLRKASDRTGTLRIVTIRDLDRSACGGTHVRTTGEIGAILLRGVEKVRGNLRLEFLCGLRAIRRARADFEALSKVAKGLTAPLDEVPRLVSAMTDRLGEADRVRRKLALELAGHRGRQLYTDTVPSDSGVRLQVRSSVPLDDELRAEAQAFTSAERAVFIGFSLEPPAILVASSKDGPFNAGASLKAALTALGGRGGGSAIMAQGSVPDAGSVSQVVEALMRQVVPAS